MSSFNGKRAFTSLLNATPTWIDDQTQSLAKTRGYKRKKSEENYIQITYML